MSTASNIKQLPKDWITTDTLQNKRVRELNNRFTALGSNSIPVVTSGIKAKSDAFLQTSIVAVEHDCR